MSAGHVTLNAAIRQGDEQLDGCAGAIHIFSDAVMEPVFDQTGAARVAHDAGHYQHLIQESLS